MRQTGGGGGGGSQIVCEREMEESLSNSPGPLILRLVHTCFPQNFLYSSQGRSDTEVGRERCSERLCMPRFR